MKWFIKLVWDWKFERLHFTYEESIANRIHHTTNSVKSPRFDQEAMKRTRYSTCTVAHQTDACNITRYPNGRLYWYSFNRYLRHHGSWYSFVAVRHYRHLYHRGFNGSMRVTLRQVSVGTRDNLHRDENNVGRTYKNTLVW